jgi:hypothetical protein
MVDSCCSRVNKDETICHFSSVVMKQYLVIIYMFLLSFSVNTADFSVKDYSDFISNRTRFLPGENYKSSLIKTLEWLNQKIKSDQDSDSVASLSYQIGVTKLLINHDLTQLDNRDDYIERTYQSLKSAIEERDPDGGRKYRKRVDGARVYLGILVAKKYSKPPGKLLDEVYRILKKYRGDSRLNKVIMAQLIIKKKHRPKNENAIRMTKLEALREAERLILDSYSDQHVGSASNASSSARQRRGATEIDAMELDSSAPSLRDKKLQDKRTELLRIVNQKIADEQKINGSNPKRQVKQIHLTESDEEDYKSSSDEGNGDAGNSGLEIIDNPPPTNVVATRQQTVNKGKRKRGEGEKNSANLTKEQEDEIAGYYLLDIEDIRLTYDEIAQLVEVTRSQVSDVVHKRRIANRKYKNSSSKKRKTK